MKKNLRVLFFLLLINLFSSNIFAAIPITSNEFVVNKYLKVSLSEGEWHRVSKRGYSWYGLDLDSYTLAKIKDNRLIEFITIHDWDIAGVYESYINVAIQEIFITNKYDGCYERPEYYLLVRFKRGNSLNCLTVSLVQTDKVLNNPDDPAARGAFSLEKKWFRDNNIDVPKIMIGSDHVYFSRLVRGALVGISYAMDPMILNSPPIKNITEETSEFHKFNIENYPEHKKVMEKLVSISAERHKEFEKNHKAKKHHLLDLSKYISNTSSTENKTGVVENLKKLEDLYKSGVLTKEEFEKAKKKLLN